MAARAGLTPETFANVQRRKRGRPSNLARFAVNAGQAVVETRPSKRQHGTSSDTIASNVDDRGVGNNSDQEEHGDVNGNDYGDYGDDFIAARNRFEEQRALEGQADWAHNNQAGTRIYVRPQQEFKV
jgi:hypothetical protein